MVSVGLILYRVPKGHFKSLKVSEFEGGKKFINFLNVLEFRYFMQEKNIQVLIRHN